MGKKTHQNFFIIDSTKYNVKMKIFHQEEYNQQINPPGLSSLSAQSPRSIAHLLWENSKWVHDPNDKPKLLFIQVQVT